jgi:hypothetical protein
MEPDDGRSLFGRRKDLGHSRDKGGRKPHGCGQKTAEFREIPPRYTPSRQPQIEILFPIHSHLLPDSVSRFGPEKLYDLNMISGRKPRFFRCLLLRVKMQWAINTFLEIETALYAV